jgi:hypothetical protein
MVKTRNVPRGEIIDFFQFRKLGIAVSKKLTRRRNSPNGASWKKMVNAENVPLGEATPGKLWTFFLYFEN